MSLSSAPGSLTAMPESIEDFHSRVLAAQRANGGHLPLDPGGFTAWPSFPFEGDLTVKPIAELGATEQEREGEDPADCHCAPGTAASPDWPVRWRDAHWQIKQAPPSGSPLILILEPREHGDLGDLTPERAAEYGRLSVQLVQAVEALPSVGRCHINRWGDGGLHAHIWFIARPARMGQLRGTFNSLWDDLLPPVPAQVRRANADAVLGAVVTAYGGELLDG
jgi:hypothetical protein